MKKTVETYPYRIIPFDIGKNLNDTDCSLLMEFLDHSEFPLKQLTARQKSIFKNILCSCYSNNNHELTFFIFKNGIVVCCILDESLSFDERESSSFSIKYGENRKKAHNELFQWEHRFSTEIWGFIEQLRIIVRQNNDIRSIRKSSSIDFENRGLSYVMTLSMFAISKDITGNKGFKGYPKWLQNNIYAMLDPSLVFLEDSSVFLTSEDITYDLERIIDDIECDEIPKDYEKHRNVDIYMSWAAVLVVGEITGTEIEEYLTLEIQLQCDWYYIYCMEKELDNVDRLEERDAVIRLQEKGYEIELIKNRLYDFDDSSMPSRIIDIQQGLVETSGLDENIEHLNRRIAFVLEREKLHSEIRQKKLAQSSELLLFIIAFIEIAPTVAEYGEKIFHNAGVIVNLVIIVIGLVLLLRKDRL